jgi:superfamily II DNA helicase RecQ
MTYEIAKLIRSRFEGESGIIYCLTKNECENVANILKKNYQIKCDYYHAELQYSKRKDVQDRWMNDEI